MFTGLVESLGTIVHRHPDSPIAQSYLALAKAVMDELKQGQAPPQLPELNF